MRFSSVLFVSALVAGCCVTAYLGDCIDVHADTVYRQMTPEESYSFYGDALDVIYYSTTGYKHTTLHPSPNHNVYYRYGSDINGVNIPDWVKSTDLPYVVYYANVSDYSQNPEYLGVNLNPNVHFDNCTSLRFCAAGYLGSFNTVSSAAYNASFIKIYAGNELQYTNSPYTYNNVYPYWDIRRSGGNAFRVFPVWCDFDGDTIGSISLLQVGFNGVRLDSGELTIYLSCPLVNDTAVTGTGVITGTTSSSSGTGTDINVNVDVDLHETNGLLSGIIDAVDGLIDSLIGLFVPDSDFLDVWCSNMQDLLEDHLGGAYDAIGLLIDFIESLYHPSSVGSISCPTVNLPGGLTLGGWTLQLRTSASGFDTLYTGLAWIIDFIATAAFLNTCRKKVEIFLNPDSEVVSNDN